MFLRVEAFEDLLRLFVRLCLHHIFELEKWCKSFRCLCSRCFFEREPCPSLVKIFDFCLGNRFSCWVFSSNKREKSNATHDRLLLVSEIFQFTFCKAQQLVLSIQKIDGAVDRLVSDFSCYFPYQTNGEWYSPCSVILLTKYQCKNRFTP